MKTCNSCKYLYFKYGASDEMVLEALNFMLEYINDNLLLPYSLKETLQARKVTSLLSEIRQAKNMLITKEKYKDGMKKTCNGCEYFVSVQKRLGENYAICDLHRDRLSFGWTQNGESVSIPKWCPKKEIEQNDEVIWDDYDSYYV